MLTPAGLLTICDAALADADRGPRWGRRNRVVLHLTGPVCLGMTGAPDPDAGDWGYTYRQVQRIRRTILDAAAADAAVTTRQGDTA